MIKGNKKLATELCEKVKKEYTEFIDDVKKEDPDYIIKIAYAIVWKEYITQYIENESLYLSKEQYTALLSVKNTLDELYIEWLTSSELNVYDDIEILLENTADAILISSERNQQKEDS